MVAMLCQLENQLHLFFVHVLFVEPPGLLANQAVGGRLVELILPLNTVRVALQCAEPRPADRHAAAHALANFVGRLFTEPQNGRLAIAPVFEHLGTLFGDYQRLAAMV